MQKKTGLHLDFCGCMVAEEVSEFFWIMIELSHDLQDFSHHKEIPPPSQHLRASRVGVGYVCQTG